jgi:hypothetical protein
MDSNEIYTLVEQNGSPSMSDFQGRYFVVNSQVTNHRRVQQALIEIETRIAAKKQVERNMKRTSVEKKIKERELAYEKDELVKELILLDIDQLNYDLSVYEKKLIACLNELEMFSNVVKDIAPDMETLKAFCQPNEEEEQQYWITRMAKQAAMDLISTGRIGQGNLDSIAMMPLGDQQETIKAALKYNGMLNRGIAALERTAQEELALLPSNLKYIDDIVNDQRLLEDKTKGEDI